MRFAFGANWLKFAERLDESDVNDSEQSLQQLLSPIDLKGKTFLDIGSGSGLSSLSAYRLGAKLVHSFDYDSRSVECTRSVRQRFAESAENWNVEQGDVLDAEYLTRLGAFDVVHCWGVLHHTGDMWRALRQTLGRVAEGGILVIAIYNDQGWRSKWWQSIKKRYVQASPWGKRVIVAPFLGYFGARALARKLFRGGDTRRGMRFYYDTVDWVGGYPFEVASRDQIKEFMSSYGFELMRLKSVGSKLGCNEFVFSRTDLSRAKVRNDIAVVFEKGGRV